MTTDATLRALVAASRALREAYDLELNAGHTDVATTIALIAGRVAEVIGKVQVAAFRAEEVQP